MRVWWLLVRRSTTIRAGVLVAAIDIWLSISSVTPGLDLWADRVSGLSTASLFTGAVAAGSAALEAGRWAAATRVHDASAARSHVITRLLHCSAAATPVLGGYLVALSVLSIRAGVTGTYGAPSALWLVVLGCALLGASHFGWAVGSLGGGRWWVTPAAAVFFFGGYVSVQVLPLPNGIRVLFPVLLVQDFVFTTPVTSTFLGILAAVLGTSVLLLLLTGGGRRAALRGRLIAVTTIAGVLVLAGSTSSMTRDGQYLESFAPHDDVCSSGGAEVCVNRGYAIALPALVRHVTAMSAHAAGTPLVASRLEQNIEGDPAPSNGARAIHIEQYSGPDDITLAVYRYVTQYGISKTCHDNGEYSTGPRAVVDTWLSGFKPSDMTPAESRSYDRLRSLPAKRGAAWFRAHYAQYRSCQLRLTDLP